MLPPPGGGSAGKNDGTNSATSAENPNGLIVRARRKPVVPSGPLASFDTSENGCSGSDADLAFNRSRDRSRSGRSSASSTSALSDVDRRSSTRSARASSFDTGGAFRRSSAAAASAATRAASAASSSCFFDGFFGRGARSTRVARGLPGAPFLGSPVAGVYSR